MPRFITWLAYGHTLFIVAASLGKFVINFLPAKVEHSDKIGHFIAYAFFAWLWNLYFLKVKYYSFLKAIIITLGWSIFFGVFMELCQWMFTSYRQFDYYDMLANSAGSVIGLFLFCIYFKFTEKKRLKDF